MQITWLGQGSFLFESAGKRLAVDPYLSNSLDEKGFPRMFASPVKPSDLRADYIVCTHDHGDHFDPDSVLPAVGAYPEAVVIGPDSVAKHAGELGVSVTTISPEQDAKDFGPFNIKAVPAFHSDPDSVGLLITADTYSVYLTGDSNYEDSLAEVALRYGPVDLLLICINGKLNNMPYTDALKVAEVIKPRVSIPMHYGMFECNTIDPAIFTEAATEAGIKAVAMEVNCPATAAELLGEESRPVPFRGIVPPVVTPLKSDETLDEAAFRAVIKKLVDGGCPALFLCGTAGVGPALTDDVYKKVLEVALDEIPDGVYALAGVMEPSTARTVQRLKLAESIGYRYAVVGAPYFFVPRTDAQFMAHFGECAKATAMDLIAYNLPQYTHCEIPADQLVNMFKRGWISGVKESSGNDEYFSGLCNRADKIGLPVFQGNRPIFAQLVAMHAAGAVPVPANVQPELYVQAWESPDPTRQAATDELWDALVNGTDFLSGSLKKLAAEGIGTARLPYPWLG